ncbi:MAG TPA: beta-phosphoglucomutase [Sphingomicrobium sp.]|nr:beta-phosphoglucomutase [Sphingomicrobium sp.]
MSRFKAAIFDLDGVLVDSAKAHFIAWQRLAHELGIVFTERDNEALKGLDRLASLRTILALGGHNLAEDELAALAQRKNLDYLKIVNRMSATDQLPGAEKLVRSAKTNGLSCAVASASRNARLLLERVDLLYLFDYVADAATVARGKPAPDIFLDCSSALGVAPAECLAFEDAVAGIAAIKAAGMYAVGIGDPKILDGATITFPTTSAVDLPALLEY